MKKIVFLFIFGFTLGNIQAQESGVSDDSNNGTWLNHRYTIKLGAYFPLNTTVVKVGNESGNIGTEIDFAKDLGFSNYSTSFVADLNWRISRRSSLGFEYFHLNRSATKTLEKDIEFGDNTYNVNARVSSFFDSQILRVSYGYSFISKPKFEAGALIGAHVLFTDVGMRLETSSGSGAEIKDNFDFVAPLPDIGLWGNIAIAKNLDLFLNGNYFYIEVGDYSGRIFSYSAAFSYNVHRNIDIELGYTGLNFKVDMEKERLNGFLKWGYNGPALKVAYVFGRPIKIKN
ncbi:hypothetical protein [Flavobacterium agrisoli]|uniref:Uncharacterized protein n=1 Tax=Flavobacterium agrisoli TaxID=2793066 RepID=A0A934PPR5_9FLAO|nr:hypothetical protein [Flavobacterium agrisoli]MBK0370341.1 hypothetical protein [Flavobacterium agrisoli]